MEFVHSDSSIEGNILEIEKYAKMRLFEKSSK